MAKALYQDNFLTIHRDENGDVVKVLAEFTVDLGAMLQTCHVSLHSRERLLALRLAPVQPCRKEELVTGVDEGGVSLRLCGAGKHLAIGGARCH